jgi:hypothetical protein
VFPARLNLEETTLASILAYEYSHTPIPKGEFTTADVMRVVRAHFYSQSDELIEGWERSTSEEKKKALRKWALKVAKQHAGSWEKLAEDHYVCERGETTLVLFTSDSAQGSYWHLHIRTTGKRERTIRLATNDLDTAKQLADIYARGE